MKAAAYKCHIPTVIYLIEAGCDHLLRDKKGKSALDFMKEKQPDKVKEVQVTPSLLLTYLLTLAYALTYSLILTLAYSITYALLLTHLLIYLLAHIHTHSFTY
jgi:hypothetical protein